MNKASKRVTFLDSSFKSLAHTVHLRLKSLWHQKEPIYFILNASSWSIVDDCS